MASFAERIAALEAEGYANATAMARLAHDVVLKALETCGLRDNVTIKGGVVMSNMTGDVRRATMDMDVDFMRYGLTDENIDEWIGRLNCLEGVSALRAAATVILSSCASRIIAADGYISPYRTAWGWRSRLSLT